MVTGGALVVVTNNVIAQAPTRSCLTDQDSSDRPDYGTRTGLSDQDSADAAGRGTLTNQTDSDSSDRPTRGRSWRCAERNNGGRYTGITDSDSGPGRDAANYGRGSGRQGVTDNDPSDAPGNGRGRRGNAGITDSDSGPGADAAGNGRGSRSPSTASEIELPRFPWPPPQPSEQTTLPRTRLARVFGPEASLYDVAEHLIGGLNRAAYSEHSFYAVPDGFALVARLERITDDGRPASDQYRYMPPGGEPFSLSTYLTGLFVAPVGRYRQIVFVVTGQPFVASGRALTERRASDILRQGANILPARYRSIRFNETHQVTALIYEFVKSGQQPMQQTNSGRLGAVTHLRRSGIYEAVVP